MKPVVPPVPEFHGVDRARFEGEIVPAGRPAVLRGLVADWPIVRAAATSDEALADYLRARATDEAGEAWFAEPVIAGRFGFNDALDGHNHERKRATVAQLLDLLLRQKGHAQPHGVYAGALAVRKHVPALLDENVMPLLAMDRPMLVSLWLGNQTKTAAHWDLPQNLACVVAGRRRFTLVPDRSGQRSLCRADRLHVGRAAVEPGRCRGARLRAVSPFARGVRERAGGRAGAG